jgi:Ribbon-helix-helix protein, copG family
MMKSMSEAGAVKLSVNISAEQAAALRQLAKQRNQSMTEVIRHALAMEQFLQDEVIDPKAKLYIEERGGDRKQVMLVGV